MAHAECIAQRKLAEQRAQEGLGELGLDSKHKGGSPKFLLTMRSAACHLQCTYLQRSLCAEGST